MAEHHAEQRWLADGEVHIDSAHGLDSLRCAGRECLGFGASAVGHVDEALRHHLGDDLILVGEVAIGRRGRNPGQPAGVRQAEVIAVALADQLPGGINQCLPQFAMVIGALHVDLIPAPPREEVPLIF